MVYLKLTSKCLDDIALRNIYDFMQPFLIRNLLTWGIRRAASGIMIASTTAQRMIAPTPPMDWADTLASLADVSLPLVDDKDDLTTFNSSFNCLTAALVSSDVMFLTVTSPTRLHGHPHFAVDAFVVDVADIFVVSFDPVVVIIVVVAIVVVVVDTLAVVLLFVAIVIGGVQVSK